MPTPSETELLVLGGGPGGYAAAFLAADRGMRVVLVDAAERPGGTCLHVGCIPSKALLHAARLITEAEEAKEWGLHFTAPRIDLDALRGQKLKVVETLAKNLLEMCQRRKVEFVHARGALTSANAVRLDGGQEIRFKHCVVATGSSPTRIPGLSLDTPRCMDSTAALRLDEVPKSLLVVGGGYIGLELGTVYAALGSKVTVVELTSGLLPGVDRDLVRPLQARLAPRFHKIYVDTKVNALTETAEGIQVSLEGEEVTEREPVFDRVLVSVGRRPNSKGIGLEAAGVQVDGKGFAIVDAQRRTTTPNIFAIGDVAGEPMLAHKAAYDAKVVAAALAGEPSAADARAIPAVVFTDPEIAWCGLTETDARRDKRKVEVARFPWAASGRAATLGRQEGLTKLVLEPETERILGVGIVGVHAGELIAEGVLALEMGATAKDLALTVHAHPTLSETMGEAAEVAGGSAIHLYRPKK